MAQFTLGQMHRKRYKGKVDHAKSLEYFKKSFQGGFQPAA
jgi:TPR repeat protein